MNYFAFRKRLYNCSSFIRQLIISENSCKENRNLLLDCCSVGIRKGENFISTKCMFWKDAEIGKMCTYSMMHAWCCAAALPSVPRCCQKKWNAKSLQKWLKINLQYGKLPTFQSQELLWNYCYRKKTQKLLYEYHQSNFLYSKQRQTDKLSRLSFFDLQ